jgi:hypothetical protein
LIVHGDQNDPEKLKVQSVSVPDPTDLKTELNDNGYNIIHESNQTDHELAHQLGGSHNPKNDHTGLVAHGDENDPKKVQSVSVPDPVSLETKLKFNDTGYIIHESSKKLVHPRGDSHKFKNNTSLVVHENKSDPTRLKVRFVPVHVQGHDRFGYIEHVSSGKIIHPYRGSVKPGKNTELVYHDDRHHGALFKFDEEACVIEHIGGKILHPYGGLANPSNNTVCVLHSDRHPAARFYFGDIDGKRMSPYQSP